MKKSGKCRVCGKRIRMMIYRYTDFCCQRCEKAGQAANKEFV